MIYFQFLSLLALWVALAINLRSIWLQNRMRQELLQETQDMANAVIAARKQEFEYRQKLWELENTRSEREVNGND